MCFSKKAQGIPQSSSSIAGRGLQLLCISVGVDVKSEVSVAREELFTCET